MAIWEVVGGAQKGGVLVRLQKDTSSELADARLSTGSLVRELAKEGDRLQYRLLLGEGPPTGWVSLSTGTKQLLVLSEKVWMACGGVDKGGLLVRQGCELTSELFPERLATGATVLELEPVIDGSRLHYQLLDGSGPKTGWVTVQAQGKELMRKAVASAAMDAPACEPIKERKIRILALAGSLTCKEMIRYQCGPLAAMLGKETAEWTFAEGTVQHPWEFSAHLSDFEKALAGKRQQIWSWYEDIYHCPKERSIIEKQFDKEVVVETVEIEDKVAKLRQRLEEEGPFDVLIGFSQGCIMMHFLIGLLWKEGRSIPWKLSIFFEGMHIRDHRYDSLFAESLPHRTIHIFGKASPFYLYAREGWCSSKKVEDYYRDPKVLLHQEGHCFPVLQPDAKEIYELLCQEIKRHGLEKS